LPRELDISEPPLYTSDGIRDIAGLEAVDRTALCALLARILDGSRFFEFKVTHDPPLSYYFCSVFWIRIQLVLSDKEK
jgi:hypothetical protein